MAKRAKRKVTPALTAKRTTRTKNRRARIVAAVEKAGGFLSLERLKVQVKSATAADVKALEKQRRIPTLKAALEPVYKQNKRKQPKQKRARRGGGGEAPPDVGGGGGGGPGGPGYDRDDYPFPDDYADLYDLDGLDAEADESGDSDGNTSGTQGGH